MFDFTIYDKRLHKSYELEMLFRDEVIEYMYRNAYPSVDFARGKSGPPGDEVKKKKPLGSITGTIYQDIDSAKAFVIQEKNECLKVAIESVFQVGGIEVKDLPPVEVNKKNEIDKPIIQEFRSHEKKSNDVDKALDKINYTGLVRNFPPPIQLMEKRRREEQERLALE